MLARLDKPETFGQLSLTEPHSGEANRVNDAAAIIVVRAVLPRPQGVVLRETSGMTSKPEAAVWLEIPDA